MTAVAVSSATFEQEVLRSAEPVLVDFYAEYCRPCKAMEPILHEAAKELQGRVKIVKFDVEKNLDVAEKYAIRGMPTLLLFKDGKPLARHVGAIMQKAKLAEWIDAFSAGSRSGPRTTAFKLSNGMDVVVIASKNAPDVAHVLHYKAGAADVPGNSGVAHVLWHLMAESAVKSGVKEFGFSTQDLTYYTQRTSKDLLSGVMQGSADRMANFRFSDEEVDDALQKAREQRGPVGGIYEQMSAALHGSDPHGVSEEGLEHELGTRARESVKQFHKRYYAPNNAVLVVAGDVIPDEVKKLAEETYGKIPAGPEVGERLRPAQALLEAPRRFSAKGPASRGAWFNRQYLVPSYLTGQSGEAEALELVTQLLSRRLHRRLAAEEELATDARAVYTGQCLGFGTFLLSAKVLGGDFEKIEAAVDQAIEELRTSGPSEADLKGAIEAQEIRCSGVSQDGNGLASRYGEALALGRTIAQVDGWPEAIAKVTTEDIKNVANTYLDPRRAVTGWLLVDEGDAHVVGDVTSIER